MTCECYACDACMERLFGPCPTVDPGDLMRELGELRADLRTIERAHGWHDDDADSEPVEMNEVW